jgi:hypothetical protein
VRPPNYLTDKVDTLLQMKWMQTEADHYSQGQPVWPVVSISVLSQTVSAMRQRKQLYKDEPSTIQAKVLIHYIIPLKLRNRFKVGQHISTRHNFHTAKRKLLLIIEN